MMGRSFECNSHCASELTKPFAQKKSMSSGKNMNAVPLLYNDSMLFVFTSIQLKNSRTRWYLEQKNTAFSRYNPFLIHIMKWFGQQYKKEFGHFLAIRNISVAMSWTRTFPHTQYTCMFNENISFSATMTIMKLVLTRCSFEGRVKNAISRK